jgi:MIP family channel proteins
MKKYTAEFIGTFALILIGAGAVATFKESSLASAAGLLPIALAHGLTVATMIYALGHISGIHINPAVTVAMKIAGKINNKDFVGYIVAQLIGAAVAGFVLKSLFNPGPGTGFLGATDLASGLTPGKAVLCEAIGTFIFFTVIFGAAVDGRSAGNMAGLAIGLSLTACILLFGPLTGGSFNPARSFGPALASGHWDNFWVYLVGPILGGSLAGLLQTKFFMGRE